MLFPRVMFLVCLLLFSFALARNYANGKKVVDRIQLLKYSFEAPLTYDNSLNLWEMGGAAIPTEDHVVLTPMVANRTGHFWHRDPLKTSNFEVQFDFKVTGSDFSKSDGFAFWYVYEDFTKIFPPTAENKPLWNLFGYKQNFKGLGVFFSNLDSRGLMSPSISGLLSNGVENVQKDSLPTKDSLFFKYRNSNEPIQFKLSVGPKGVLAQVRYTQSSPWLDCFLLSDLKLQAGGYLGFSSYSGPAATDSDTAFVAGGVNGADAKKGDRVVIPKMLVFNLDLSAPAPAIEDPPAAGGKDGAAVKTDPLFNDDDKTPVDIRQLHELTALLYKHIDQQTPREQAVFTTLNQLQNAVHRMISDVKELTLEVRSVQTKGHGDALHSIKSEVVGLKSVFSRQTENQAATMAALNKKVESIKFSAPDDKELREVDKLSITADSLEETIHSQAVFSAWVIAAVVVVVLGLALTMWRRVTEMEKKHMF